MTVLSRSVGLRLVLPVVLGTLLNAVNSSMIAVALVDIQHEFHAGAEVVWLVSGLYLATAVAQPTMGRLADRFGARRVFCWGLVIVMAAAIGAPFAPGLGWLVAARVLLGIGTSAAYPSGISLIRQGIGGEATGALGAISAAGQVAVALGPPLGGVLVLLAGWRSIFWVNLPIAALSLVLVLLWVPRDRARKSTSVGLDPLGILLFAAAMVGLLVFLLEFRWPFLVAAVGLAAVLLWWELRVSRPFIDVRMLSANRPLSRTYARVAVTYVVFYTIFYGVPQWLEQGRLLSSAEAGLVVLPIAGMGIIATVVATRRPRLPLLVIGSAGLLAGSLALLLIGGSTSVVLLVLVSAVLGIPNGFNSLGNQTAMYAAAPTDQVGTASGLYRTSQYIGANLAAALVGLGLGDHATDSGLHLLAVVISVISAGLLAAALLRRRFLRPRNEPTRLCAAVRLGAITGRAVRRPGPGRRIHGRDGRGRRGRR